MNERPVSGTPVAVANGRNWVLMTVLYDAKPRQTRCPPPSSETRAWPTLATKCSRFWRQSELSATALAISSKSFGFSSSEFMINFGTVPTV